MAAPPTAITGSPAIPVKPATSSATPSAAAAASRPMRPPTTMALRAARERCANFFIITRPFGPGAIADWMR